MEIIQDTKNGFFRILMFFIGAALFLYNIALDCNGQLSLVISFYILAVSISFVVSYRHKPELFILFVFILYFNYGYLSAYYISPKDSFFTIYRNTQESYICQNIMLLYTLVLCLITPRTYVVNIDVNIYAETEKKNDVIVYFTSIILSVIFVLCYTRPEANQRGGGSPLYEYSIIFFMIGFMFSRNHRTDKILVVLLIMFSLQNFIYGGRVVGVQLGIVYYFMRLSYKLKMRKLAPLIFIIYLVLQFIGNTRGNYSNFSGIKDMITYAFDGLSLENDTAFSAYHTSITFVMSETCGWAKRIKMFVNFLISMVLGGSAVPDANLAEYTRRTYMHYYGGVLPMFFHFYLGYVGVVLSAFLTNFYIKMIANVRKDSSMLIKGISVYIACSVSRWYLYSPSNLIRGCLLIYVVYMAFKYIEDTITYKDKI